ncbi:hypothetical protein [Flavobacterium sp. GT3R68]|uniref:hypothetical protein n=1 Tax=Flavobacterium sp. GT3R68 TaxID=2594437 RepID=UPI000F865126|nr:hypothetical protein [Flavobacterium sp. GT3R68]RTY85448.1 hypothetical protein EKL32_28575 [Flavobacterium sp. GSN2]TRW89351.1 hypothetical protein FNW07_13460 [Flavobacterium sp. GT3R68]
MNHYLPYIFGISTLLLGIYLFLISFGIYNPKNRTTEQIKKSESFQEKYGIFMKIISVILILRGGYNLLNANPERYAINSSKKESVWSETAKDSLNKYCLIGMGKQGLEFEKINFDYCNCTSEKIMKTYSQEEYENIIKRSQEEQYKIFSELVKECKDKLNQKIDSIQK